MASLRSMILSATEFASGKLTADEVKTERYLVERNCRILSSHQTILVNTNVVMRDLNGAFNDGNWDMFMFANIPCPKPPFHAMWLEARDADGARTRAGVLVERVDVPSGADPLDAIRCFGEPWSNLANGVGPVERIKWLLRSRPANLILINYWFEVSSRALVRFCGQTLYGLDHNGNFQDACHMLWPIPADDIQKKKQDFGMNVWLSLPLHTFARLNCHNVKLVPMESQSVGSKKPRRQHVPCSIWHEIVVEDPQVRCQQDAATPSGDKQEIRFHRVRGHYADYTKGAGLFGKYKVRIWVEEHGRGNREMGEVVGSYTVQ